MAHTVDSVSTVALRAGSTTTQNQKVCTHCGATSTPLWRKGPNGPLCNACGVRFALRQKLLKEGRYSTSGGDTEKIAREKGPPSPAANPISPAQPGRGTPMSPTQSSASTSSGNSAQSSNKVYYCKFCNVTWPVGYFKNRQTFGAHCSNCSRKRKSRGAQKNSRRGFLHFFTQKFYNVACAF